MWLPFPTRLVKNGFLITADAHYAAQNGKSSQALANQLKRSLQHLIGGVIALGPEKAVDLYNSGLEAYKKSDLTNAETFFQKATQARRDYYSAYIDLALTQAEKGEQDAARKTLRKLTRIVDVATLDAESQAQVAGLKKKLGMN